MGVENRPGSPGETVAASYSFASESVRGESGQTPEENDELLLSIADVVERGGGLSNERIRALLHDGKIKGEFRPHEGRGHGKWYTSVAAVRKYQENLWTPQEWGRKGNLIAGRGRPKSRFQRKS